MGAISPMGAISRMITVVDMLTLTPTGWQFSQTQTGDNGNAMLPKKNSNFKDTRQKISAPLAMITNLGKKNLQTFQ